MVHPIAGLLAAGDFRSADVSHYLACAFAFQDCRSGRWRSPTLDLGFIRIASETGPSSLRSYLPEKSRSVETWENAWLMEADSFIFKTTALGWP